MDTNPHRPAGPESPDDHGFALAEYVEGVLSPSRTREVEDHLRQCASCSAEVGLARLGREAGRCERLTPPSDDTTTEALHERLMAGLPVGARTSPDEPLQPRPAARPGGRVGRRPFLVAAGAVVLAGAGAEGIRRLLQTDEAGAERPVTPSGTSAPSTPSTPTPPTTPTPTDSRTGGAPGVLETAVADFRAGRMPGGGRPTASGPDLRGLGLTAGATGAGALAVESVSAFEYRTGTGDRVVVYIADRAFTTPALQRAQYAPTPVQDMWAAWFPGSSPTLVVGEDERLVHAVCEALV